MEDKKIVVEYKTRKEYCSCCNQKLPKPKLSKIRGFKFSKDNCLEWLEQENWEVEAQCEDEFKSIIREFVYETIGFFSVGSDESILIENSEFDKVKHFILTEVIGV